MVALIFHHCYVESSLGLGCKHRLIDYKLVVIEQILKNSCSIKFLSKECDDLKARRPRIFDGLGSTGNTLAPSKLAR